MTKEYGEDLSAVRLGRADVTLPRYIMFSRRLAYPELNYLTVIFRYFTEYFVVNIGNLNVASHHRSWRQIALSTKSQIFTALIVAITLKTMPRPGNRKAVRLFSMLLMLFLSIYRVELKYWLFGSMVIHRRVPFKSWSEAYESVRDSKIAMVAARGEAFLRSGSRYSALLRNQSLIRIVGTRKLKFCMIDSHENFFGTFVSAGFPASYPNEYSYAVEPQIPTYATSFANKNFSYLRPMNDALLRLVDNGFVNFLYRRRSNAANIHSYLGSKTAVGLENLRFSLRQIASGMGLIMLAVVAEIVGGAHNRNRSGTREEPKLRFVLVAFVFKAGLACICLLFFLSHFKKLMN